MGVPDNFNYYLSLFIKFNLNFFPDVVQDNNLVMTAPPAFADSSMDALFFRNISSSLILLGVTLAIYSILKIFQKVSSKLCDKSCFMFIFDKIVGMFEWAGFITMMLGSYVGLCLACFLQLRNASVRNAIMYGSYVCAYVFLLALLALPGILYKITEKGHLISQEAEKHKGTPQ